MPTVEIGSGVSFDTYADLATADEYMAGAIGDDADAWRAADDDTKGRGLVTATRVIDAQRWQGTKTVEGQEHAWPRSGLKYEDGTDVDSATVPDMIVNASIELAAALVAGTVAQNAANVASGTRRLKAGSVEVEYFRNVGAAPRFPANVLALFGFWLAGTGTGIAGSESTGTSECSGERDQFKLSRSF